jgi:hypothetical protein
MDLPEMSEFRRHLARVNRIYRIAIYVPAALAVFFSIIDQSKDRNIELAFGLSHATYIRLAVAGIATSLFFYILRYLQLGVGGVSLSSVSVPGLKAEFTTLKGRERKAADELDRQAKELGHDEGGIGKVETANQTTSMMVEPRKRLLLEVDRLGRRNNLNLTFGLLCTGAGLWVLYSLAFQTKQADTDNLIHADNLVQFAISYVPRLTLIIFIEVFAYFFLGLYKKGLADIKYFQNEITNIESKAVALSAALSISDPVITSRVIENIANTERNHVLEKGQTTVELEIAKSEKESLLSLVKVIPAFAKILDKENKNNKSPG